MAITLPIGIRIAAGLLGATVDRIGTLPQELPTLAVSMAGQAVRTSFRIRQEMAELATRGDELLAGITGRPEEKPAWATFDDDEPDATAPVASTPNAAPSTPAATRLAPVSAPIASSPASTTPKPVRAPRKPVGAAKKPTGGGPTAAAGHRLSLAELKEQLRGLDIVAVGKLLAVEETGPNRAPYLTLLTNRLTTLAHENGQSESR